MSDEIRHAINAAGMSRYQISQQTGINESVLSRFMSGHSMTTHNLDRLADVLGLRMTVKRRQKKGGR